MRINKSRNEGPLSQIYEVDIVVAALREAEFIEAQNVEYNAQVTIDHYHLIFHYSSLLRVEDFPGQNPKNLCFCLGSDICGWDGHHIQVKLDPVGVTDRKKNDTRRSSRTSSRTN